MNFTAIISEYNPFHNGHKYQINMIKGSSTSHYVVAIMSGNFTQRGEPALFDKWTRARLALLSGADIILELPTLYALQSAEGFASGGVMIANGLGAVESLSFGSESADPSALWSVARTLAAEDAGFKSSLKKSLASGRSFPSARSEALRVVLSSSADILANPNDILAVEYLKALLRSQSALKPKIIKRTGAAYNDPSFSGPVSSALAIRNHIKNNDLSSAFLAMPFANAEFLEKFTKKNPPVFTENFFDFLIFKLRSMKPEEIAGVAGVSEGLQNKIKKAAAKAKNYSELLADVKSKRYTQTRISRIFMSCLLGINKQMLKEANSYQGLYARVLGYRRDSLDAFSRLCKESRIPLITSGTQLPQNVLSLLDIHASDIYSLACADRSAGSDFTKKLIIV